MKIVLKHALFAVALAFCVAGIATPQASQAAPAPTVTMVINMDVIFTQSKVGQSVNSQLQTHAKALQAENKKGEDSIQAEAKKLSGQRALLQPADFQKKLTALQQREVDHQRKMREKSQELQLGQEKARAQIQEALRPILEDIIKKNGANILLDQSVLLYSTPDLDITTEVLRRLNEKLTELTVKPIPLSSLQQAPTAAAAKKPAN